MRLKKDGTPAKKPGRKPDPNKPVRIRTGRTGPRPHVWRCGPDAYKHSMYMPWQRSKAQANFRGEEWLLSFEEYYDLWKELWPQRGRGSDDYCQSRHDPDGPWDTKNTVIITRKEHLVNQTSLRSQGKLKHKRPGPKPKAIEYAKVKK